MIDMISFTRNCTLRSFIWTLSYFSEIDALKIDGFAIDPKYAARAYTTVFARTVQELKSTYAQTTFKGMITRFIL